MNHPTQAACPYCFRSEGYVRRVTVSAHHRQFRFTCSNCRRQWDGELQDDEGVGAQVAMAITLPGSNLRLIRSPRRTSSADLMHRNH